MINDIIRALAGATPMNCSNPQPKDCAICL